MPPAQRSPPHARDVRPASMQNAGCDRIHCCYEPTGIVATGIVAVALFAACSERGLTHKGLHRHGIGPKRTDDSFGQACRIAFPSLLFARRTIFLATDIAMGALRSATFNRFKASSKAAVMAAVSSGPNAVLISRSVIGISLAYGCESKKLPVANRVRHPYRCSHEQEMNAV